MKLTPFLLASTLFAADLAQEGQRWWSHIQVLADDKMEGRNTGSEGHKRAALYVAEQFDNAGLAPAGTAGYMQAVKLHVTPIYQAQPSPAGGEEGKGTPPEARGGAGVFGSGGLVQALCPPAGFF